MLHYLPVTPTSRLLTACSLFGLLCLPTEAFAAIGLQSSASSSSLSTSSEQSSEPADVIVEPEVDTGALLKMQQEQALWALRRARSAGFWAAMMNNRKEAAAFRDQQAIRREKRTEKRIACRDDVRSANRDTVTPITFNCFRATLTMDLEMLRKEKQFVEVMAGPTEQYRKSALFHIGNLMDAISTIVQAMDAGVYGSKEDLEDAKKNLGLTYKAQRSLAMTRLRVDRAITWVAHLMVRLEDIRSFYTPPPVEVQAELSEAIACLADRQAALEALLPLEDNEALIDGFRQVQSGVKFCTEMAQDAWRLNTEIEQAEAENQES